MNDAEVLTMQQDAIRRVKEMQRRSLERVSTPITINQPVNKPQTTTFMQGLNLDSEKIMLLVLIVVLLNEGADIILVLALLYLLI